jgi:Flp pilus assembly protein TadD
MQESIAQPRWSLGGGPMRAALAALAMTLLLAACQSGPWCAGREPADPAQRDTRDPLLKVADDTRDRDPATAIDLYRSVHEKRPKDPEPLARLGSTFAALGDYDGAAIAYRAAIALAPDDPDLHRGLAVVFLSLGQPETAIAELEGTIAKHGDDPGLFNALGVAQDLMGRHELAQQAYQNGLTLAPDNPGLRNNYALSLALSRDYPGAAEALLKIAGAPSAPTRYRLNLALVYGLAGDDEKAASIARSTLNETAVRNNLAYYALLRAMDDRARIAALMGGDRGSGFAESRLAAGGSLTSPPVGQGPDSSPPP